VRYGSAYPAAFLSGGATNNQTLANTSHAVVAAVIEGNFEPVSLIHSIFIRMTGWLLQKPSLDHRPQPRESSSP
jgi:hypothetical protein